MFVVTQHVMLEQTIPAIKLTKFQLYTVGRCRHGGPGRVGAEGNRVVPGSGIRRSGHQERGLRDHRRRSPALRHRLPRMLRGDEGVQVHADSGELQINLYVV